MAELLSKEKELTFLYTLNKCHHHYKLLIGIGHCLNYY